MHTSLPLGPSVFVPRWLFDPRMNDESVNIAVDCISFMTRISLHDIDPPGADTNIEAIEKCNIRDTQWSDSRVYRTPEEL
jgi:hypothetical protein